MVDLGFQQIAKELEHAVRRLGFGRSAPLTAQTMCLAFAFFQAHTAALALSLKRTVDECVSPSERATRGPPSAHATPHATPPGHRPHPAPPPA